MESLVLEHRLTIISPIALSELGLGTKILQDDSHLLTWSILVESAERTTSIDLRVKCQSAMSCGRGELSEEGTRTCLFRIICDEEGALTKQAVASLG
jgi:hypothetical protein